MWRGIALCFMFIAGIVVAGDNSFQKPQPFSENFKNRRRGTPISTPAAPSGLTATVISQTQIDLEWINNSPGLGGNILQRCTGVGCSGFQTLQDLSPAREAASDLTCSAGTSYTYRVAAYSLGRVSSYSSEVTAVASAAATATPTATPTFTPTNTPTPTQTPTPPAGAPSAPTNLSATAVGITQVDLAWTDTASDETGFKVNRCTGSSCSNFAEVYDILTPNTQTKSDTGLTGGTVYCYNVTAYNGSGTSDPTNEAGDQTWTPTPAPTATPTNTPTSTQTPTPTATPTQVPGGSCAANESTTGAAAAWCLSETDTQVVDSVASITLAGYGSPTYSVTASSPWDGYSPGVTITTGQGFYVDGVKSAMNIGTGDANFMWVATKNAVSASYDTIFVQDDAWSKGVACYWYNASFERIGCDVYNSAADYDTCTWNTSTTQGIPGDGAYHKYELRLSRSGNTMKLFIDDVEQAGGCDMGAVSGDTLTNTGFWLGTDTNTGGNPYLGTIQFLRMKLTAE